MNKMFSVIIRIIAAVVAAATFCLVWENPTQPALLLLREGIGQSDRAWAWIMGIPVISDSQRARIGSFLSGTGVRPLEGFASLRSAAHAGNAWSYFYYDDRAHSWWTENLEPGQEITWDTATCPDQDSVVVVFSGALGESGHGRCELRLGDEPVLLFDASIEDAACATGEGKVWDGAGCRLGFFLIKRTHPYNQTKSGIFCLVVPREKFAAGKPLTITVKSVEPAPSNPPHFILYDCDHTLKYIADEKAVTKFQRLPL
jgi:hypothetical protein